MLESSQKSEALSTNSAMLAENDVFFLHEMLSHPILFTHPSPTKVAIIGQEYGVLEEVLKHACVQEVYWINTLPLAQDHLDTRVKYGSNPKNFLTDSMHTPFDIIIQDEPAEKVSHEQFIRQYALLNNEGILLYPCQSSLLAIDALKSTLENIERAGFEDYHILNFPHPSHPIGWRTILLLFKTSRIRRIREKAIFNRAFTTRYYNFDTHMAALALPEFARALKAPLTEGIDFASER